MRVADDRPGTPPCAAAYVNRGIIMACTLAFVLGLRPEPFAFVPAYFYGTVELAGPLPTMDVWRGLFGHVLIHGDVVHLVSNMLALWAFGDAVEEAMGSLRYLLFFLLCAAAGALAEGALTADPMAPLVGASGAICGVMGAYLLLHPQATLGLSPGPRIPAALVVGGFLGINVAMTLMPPAPDSGLADVAWADPSQVIDMGGGVPLLAHGQIVGAVSVSGLAHEDDHALIIKAASRLIGR